MFTVIYIPNVLEIIDQYQFKLTVFFYSGRVAPYFMLELTMPNKKSVNFEQSLEQLELLVRKMESGEMPLEDSLKAFEEGIGLVRQCQKSLTEAEQRVQILMSQNGKSELKPFKADE